MKFKPGDFVEIIRDPKPEPSVAWVQAGMVGTVVGFRFFPFWSGELCVEVDFDGKHVGVAESVLRLVPSDPEGRQTVEWDWRTLNSNQEA